MRLLLTDKDEFREFSKPPKGYAILSHRWQRQEVSYKHVKKGQQQAYRLAWAKIRGFCETARDRGIKYAWVDTCCIDKSSSSELIESINSMFYWYGQAEECYVYLSDVQVPDVNSPDSQVQFKRSNWFTRGWTLQELIAPRTVLFFNRQWQLLGTRYTLRDTLKKVTGVSIDVLCGGCDPIQYSVSQRMSWAAQRVTTKQEDQAYSLLGIFGVNMVMLYGERNKAFQRLQEEIIKRSDDQTIFAWQDERPVKGFLAPSPDCFKDTYDLMPIYPTSDTTDGFQLLNVGLVIHLHLIPWEMNIYLAPLRCGYAKNQNTQSSNTFSRGYRRACIFLRQTKHVNQFIRVSVGGNDLIFKDGDEIAEIRERLQIQERRVILQRLVPSRLDESPLDEYTDSFFYGFELHFEHSNLFESGNKPLPKDVLCHHKWNVEKPIFKIEKRGLYAAGLLRLSGFVDVFMCLGFDMDFAPICLITNQTPWPDEALDLPTDLTLLLSTEKLQLLDINRLRKEVAKNVGASEVILAVKADRYNTFYAKCDQLGLELTFERRWSTTVLKNAWHIDFQHIPISIHSEPKSRGMLGFLSRRSHSYVLPRWVSSLSHAFDRSHIHQQRCRSPNSLDRSLIQRRSSISSFPSDMSDTVDISLLQQKRLENLITSDESDSLDRSPIQRRSSISSFPSDMSDTVDISLLQQKRLENLITSDESDSLDRSPIQQQRRRRRAHSVLAQDMGYNATRNSPQYSRVGLISINAGPFQPGRFLSSLTNKLKGKKPQFFISSQRSSSGSDTDLAYGIEYQ